MTIPHKPFYFQRHGETDWNRRGVAQGQTDIALNSTGRAQALEAAEVLREEAIDRIVSSPLSRAADTAAAASAATGLDVDFNIDLQEIGFGALEGLGHSERIEQYWAGDYLPEGAERLADFDARIRAGLRAALSPPGVPLIVSHGAVWRRVMRILDLSPKFWLTNCAIVRLDRASDGWRWRNVGVAELVWTNED